MRPNQVDEKGNTVTTVEVYEAATLAWRLLPGMLSLGC
jgi:hypothetical protein